MPGNMCNVSVERNGGSGLELEQADYLASCFRTDAVFVEIPVAVLGRQIRDGVKDLLNPISHLDGDLMVS
jgi:hypothetical protein